MSSSIPYYCGFARMRIINGVKAGVKSVIRLVVKADEFGREYSSRFIVLAQVQKWAVGLDPDRQGFIDCRGAGDTGDKYLRVSRHESHQSLFPFKN